MCCCVLLCLKKMLRRSQGAASGRNPHMDAERMRNVFQSFGMAQQQTQQIVMRNGKTYVRVTRQRRQANGSVVQETEEHEVSGQARPASGGRFNAFDPLNLGNQNLRMSEAERRAMRDMEQQMKSTMKQVHFCNINFLACPA